MKCPFCGKEIVQGKTKPRKYCSTKCYRDYLYLTSRETMKRISREYYYKNRKQRLKYQKQYDIKKRASKQLDKEQNNDHD